MSNESANNVTDKKCRVALKLMWNLGDLIVLMKCQSGRWTNCAEESSGLFFSISTVMTCLTFIRTDFSRLPTVFSDTSYLSAICEMVNSVTVKSRNIAHGTGHHTFSAYITCATSQDWAQRGRIDHNITKVVSGIAVTALDPTAAATETVRILKDMRSA